MTLTTALESVLQSFHAHDRQARKRFEQTSQGVIHRGIPRGESRILDWTWNLTWIAASAAQANAIDQHFGEVGTHTAFDFYPPPDVGTPVRVCYGSAPRITPNGGEFAIQVTLQEF